MSGGGRAPDNASTILVLGILGLLVCQPLGVVAWIQGNSYLQRCREIGVAPDGQAVAGRICGMVATFLMALSLLMFCALFGMSLLSAGLG